MANPIQYVALVTGATAGIGFEIVAQLLEQTSPTWHVFLGARFKEKGEAAVTTLKARHLPGTVEAVHLDLIDDTSIETAAAYATATRGHVDVVVQNGAYGHPGMEATRENMRLSFDTNVTGAWSVGEHFAPLLIRAADGNSSWGIGPRIVNITSGAGSIQRRLDSQSPTYNADVLAYRCSKAALNMLAACQKFKYGPQGVKVFLFNPGHTVNSVNRIEDGAKSTEESVRPIIRLIQGERDAEEGQYLNYDGGTYPW